MPTNKNALIRYQTLNTCFSNPGRNYFIEDLLEECNKAIVAQKPSAIGIQKRQLFEDIKFMESSLGWNIPLERCKSGKRIFYRYSDPKFSINNFPMRVSELDKIKAAIRVLQRIKGIPKFHWIQELYLKLGNYNSPYLLLPFIRYNPDNRAVYYYSSLNNKSKTHWVTYNFPEVSSLDIDMDDSFNDALLKFMKD